jgi:hypothetical protein
MNKEVLDLLRKLQPKIRDVMGEPFLFGDRWIAITDRGELFERILGMGDSWPQKDVEAGYEIVRVPPSIDHDRPERGLWGMIQNKWKSLSERNSLVDRYKVEILIEDEGETVSFFGDTPYLTILRAYDWQESQSNTKGDKS